MSKCKVSPSPSLSRIPRERISRIAYRVCHCSSLGINAENEYAHARIKYNEKLRGIHRARNPGILGWLVALWYGKAILARGRGHSSEIASENMEATKKPSAGINSVGRLHWFGGTFFSIFFFAGPLHALVAVNSCVPRALSTRVFPPSLVSLPFFSLCFPPPPPPSHPLFPSFSAQT